MQIYRINTSDYYVISLLTTLNSNVDISWKMKRQIFNTEYSVKRGILHGNWFNRVTEWRNIEFQVVYFLIIDLSYVEQSVQKI